MTMCRLRSLRSYLSNNNGVTALETGVSIGVFMLTMFLVFEIARFFFYQALLQHAVAFVIQDERVQFIPANGGSESLPSDQFAIGPNLSSGCVLRGDSFNSYYETNGSEPIDPDSATKADLKTRILSRGVNMLEDQPLTVQYALYNTVGDLAQGRVWTQPDGSGRDFQILEIVAQYKVPGLPARLSDFFKNQFGETPDVFYACARSVALREG